MYRTPKSIHELRVMGRPGKKDDIGMETYICMYTP